MLESSGMEANAATIRPEAKQALADHLEWLRRRGLPVPKQIDFISQGVRELIAAQRKRFRGIRVK